MNLMRYFLNKVMFIILLWKSLNWKWFNLYWLWLGLFFGVGEGLLGVFSVIFFFDFVNMKNIINVLSD